MSKKKICFIAQFPPPMHGLSKAVESFYNSRLNSNFNENGKYLFEKVNITKNKDLIGNIYKIICSRADLYYLTISQTKLGNIRDLVIIGILKILKKKCIIHLHGGYYRNLIENDVSTVQKKLNYYLVGKLECAIVLSESLKKIFEGIIPQEKIYIVSNCVDDEFLVSQNTFEKKLFVEGDKEVKHILWLSNFIRSKGYQTVLEMAKLEQGRVSNGGEKKYHFDFAGKFFSKEEKEEFFSYIEDNKLEEFITYHGVVGGTQKKELLEKASVFILPTIYPNEGQPISILEAMGNGLFVITTNHAAIPDYIIDGENGILIDKNCINAKKIYEQLLSYDIHKFKDIQIRNRGIVLEKYTEEIYINSLEYILDTIFGKEKQ